MKRKVRKIQSGIRSRVVQRTKRQGRRKRRKKKILSRKTTPLSLFLHEFYSRERKFATLFSSSFPFFSSSFSFFFWFFCCRLFVSSTVTSSSANVLSVPFDTLAAQPNNQLLPSRLCCFFEPGYEKRRTADKKRAAKGSGEEFKREKKQE